jgi:uncharacterized protein YcbX
MLGEECDHLDVNERGVAGDRLFAVRDAEGNLAAERQPSVFAGLMDSWASAPHIIKMFPGYFPQTAALS